ncbi:ABC transporter ATP-binding protein [Wenxinia marina]|uniref:ABC-type multidrug transport system, ATPase and permease component n=1 Tax=Wenxinia marina DSM 24838 TaxID=1123501 RepID=A0A0D0QIZ9_9RHOB|nr:ABC transporter ATP-binding protein [Wenxinia marina]KIQ71033.1 ABC-type multidrug transport system, ATPase and permease component [Wenxinia marina DSM 24838]GGL55405.1 multidrug ABC transporter ATP-binding protein [Wenxinia marina]
MFRFFETLVDPYVRYDEVDTPPTQLWPFLRQYLAPFRGVFLAAILFKAAVAFGDVAIVWYVGRLIDLLNGGTPAEVWATYRGEFILVAALILIVRPIVAAVDVGLLNNSITPNLGTLIRWRSHRHVLRQPVGWFENDFAGRLANRIMQTPPAAGEAVFQVLDAVTFAVSTLIGAVVLLGGADPILLVPLAIWTVCYALLMRWTLRRAGPASTAASEARSVITGRVVDSYTNIHSVKMFAHHDREIEYAREAIETARHAFFREMRILFRMDVTLTALNGALIVGSIGLALWLWFVGQTTIGAVAAASALVLRLNNMTYWIMWAATNLVQNLGVIREGMMTIAQPLSLTDAPGARPLKLTQGRIDVRGLTHRYGLDHGGIEGIELSVKAGEKLGIVGPSGAGKSTLVKLLLRFYAPEAGRIEIDGTDIASVTQDSLRQAMGMVQQDTALLHRSVRENILYGRPDATEAEVIAAAQRAEAHDFVLQLEDSDGNRGYDARVGERGVKLSGGQRQRVALARVILKDAPILILDEATSALDSEVEAAIQDTLYRMMEGKTVIAIAHRLSTIARMDRIVVMEAGRIVEDGSHDALLQRGGLYARLWARQSGGFLGDDTAEAAE